MKHYLVDTNVVIDMLLDREGADAACAIFDGAERRNYALYRVRLRQHIAAMGVRAELLIVLARIL